VKNILIKYYYKHVKNRKFVTYREVGGKKLTKGRQNTYAGWTKGGMTDKKNNSSGISKINSQKLDRCHFAKDIKRTNFTSQKHPFNQKYILKGQ